MNKKKAIKVLGASAIAASAFVATSPSGADAASAKDVQSLVKAAKDAGTVLKWAISTEGSADGTTRPWAQYNAAKAARDKAVAAINTLPAAQKAGYLADIEQNVNLHINRTMSYIDAITAGEKINVKKAALEAQIAKNLIDDNTEAAYHALSTEIRKQAILLDRVYGQTTRDEIRANYKKAAETVRDSVKYEVSAKIELDLAKKAIAANDTATADKHLAEAAKYMKDAKNEAMKSALAKTVAELEAQMTPKVNSVSAINATKLEVVFNKAIDKNTISLNDFTIAKLDGQTLTAANLTGTLSADGKTYTIETSQGEFFTKRYDVTLADKSVKTTDGKDLAEYKTTINVKDTVAPEIKEVTYVQAGSSKVNVTVKFDEQLNTVGTVSVNGEKVTPVFTPNSKEMTISNLEAGKTFKIDAVGVTDVAGNVANPLTTSISTSTDATLPTASVTVDGSTIKLDFSEEVVNASANAFVVKVNGGSALTAVQDQNDPTVYTVDASSALAGSTFLNNAKITVTSIYDLAGNKGQDVEVTANLIKDTTAPKFVSAKADGTKLVLKYDEAIASATATNITTTDLTVKYVNKDGVLVNLAQTTDFTASSSFGHDLNGNGQIDANTDEEKYVEVTLVQAGTKNFIEAGKLLQGKYTVTVAKDQLEDIAGNKVVASTFDVVVGADSASKTVTYAANTTGLENNQFKVVYSKDMSDNALLASNYTLGGSSLPAGTTLTFVDNKQNVLVTLPEGYVTVEGSRVVKVTGVTAVDGDLQNTDSQTQVSVNLKENVAPVANKVSISNDSKVVVDFSEVISGATTGIKVKVNGVEVTPASLNVVSGDLEVNFASGTLKATDKVTVEFSNAVLADAAGNKVQNGSVNN